MIKKRKKLIIIMLIAAAVLAVAYFAVLSPIIKKMNTPEDNSEGFSTERFLIRAAA